MTHGVRKLTAMAAAAVLSLSGFTAFADGTKYADELKGLGLFQGTDSGYALEDPLTREQAATVIVRLMGKEEAARGASYEAVFEDVAADRWSFAAVMFCYENGVTKGTDAAAFSPERAISGPEFVTLLLRLLGYSGAEPEAAYQTAVETGLLTSAMTAALEGKEAYLRDDMVTASYRALKTKTADGTLLADVLAADGVITAEQAKRFNVYDSASGIDDLIDGLLE